MGPNKALGKYVRVVYIGLRVVLLAMGARVVPGSLIGSW